MSHHSKSETSRKDVLMTTLTTSKDVHSSHEHTIECEEIVCPPSGACYYKPRHNHCDKKEKSKINYITPCNFKHGNGIILSKPGVYKLSKDIRYKPSTIGTTAISIVGSNITLDLDVYTLSQKNTVKNTYGIAICRDAKCIKITGNKGISKVLDFSMVGIRVLGRTDTITIENIIVTQTEIRSLDNSEIVPSCKDFICQTWNYGILVGEGDNTGLPMKGTDKANLVTNLLLEDVTTSRSITGTQIVMTYQITINSCNFIENTIYGLLSGPLGIVPGDELGTAFFPTTKSLVARNCRFDNNVGFNADLVGPPDLEEWFDLLAGVVLYFGEGYVMENCTVNDNFSDSFMLAVDHDRAYNVVWKGCTVARNRCDGFVDAFHASGSINQDLQECQNGLEVPLEPDLNLTIEDCSFFDTYSKHDSAKNVALLYVQGVTVKNCYSSGAKGYDDSIGFRVSGDPNGGISSGIVFENCVASNNGADTDGRVHAGFSVNNVTDRLTFRNCTASGNGLFPATYSAGFLVEPFAFGSLPPVTNRIIFENCVANGNGSESSDFSGGFAVLTVSNSDFVLVSKILIKDSTSSYNDGDGIFVGVGVESLSLKNNTLVENSRYGIDMSAVSTKSFVAENDAFNNGSPPFLLSGNYVGVPAANIVSGTSDSLPTNPGFLNTDVTLV